MAFDFSKQVGPLPMGAWIAVVGGGLGLGYYTYRQQNAAAAPTVVDNTSGQTGVGDGTVGGWEQTQPSGSTTTPITYTTNEQWETACVNWLIAQGYDPVVSDSAMRKYIAGNEPAPSLQERMLQSQALAHFGAPPQPLPPSTSPDPRPTPGPGYNPAPLPIPVPTPTPTPTPQPSPAPALVYDYVTPWPTQKSTLFGMAKAHYGDGNKWGIIYNGNRSGYRRPDGTVGQIKNPNLIYAGWKLWIPVA